MPNKNQSMGNATESDVTTTGRDVTQRVRKAAESMADVASDAAGTIDDHRSTVADGLDTAASGIHDRADDLPGGEGVKTSARAAADRLSGSADYMRTHDAKRMMADVQSFVKNNPGPALVVAAAFGFLLGRALSRD